MRRTDWPEMKSCDGCQHEVVKNACCTIIRVRPAEAKRIKRYVSDNRIKWQQNEGIKCGFLQDGKCAIYQHRPFVCRAFGVVQQLPCSRFPHEAVIDFPREKAESLGWANSEDHFLGEYFELGYNDRMLTALRSVGNG